MLICKTAPLCFRNCLGREWLGFPSLIRIRSCWTEILFPMTHPSQEAEPTPQIFPLSWPKILAFYQRSCDSRNRQKWQENSRKLHPTFKDPSSAVSNWRGVYGRQRKKSRSFATNCCLQKRSSEELLRTISDFLGYKVAVEEAKGITLGRKFLLNFS